MLFASELLMRSKLLVFLLLSLCLCAFAGAKDKKSDNDRDNQVVIAQISDSHLGLARAPEASQNLRWVVDQVNQRHPDAVIVTGDIGERPEAWQEAKEILGHLNADNILYIPGNHDDTADNVGRWRQFWGSDYGEFHIKWITIYGLDSQLLSNFDNYDSHEVQPLSANGRQEGRKMLDWFAKKIDDQKRGEAAHPEKKTVVFAMQHVPISRADGGRFPNDPKPYWAMQEPGRSAELELLHRLGVKDMFVGHWHIGMNYKADGINYHVAPATSWSPFSDKLGFALHTIKRDGSVKTEFVYIPGANPHKP